MASLKSSAKKKRKKKKGNSVLLRASRWLAAVFFASFLTWSLLVPTSAGTIGGSIHALFTNFLGPSAYLIPLFLFYALMWFYRTEDLKGLISLNFGALLIMTASTVVLGVIGKASGSPEWGGFIGQKICTSAVVGLGSIGTFFVASGVGMLGLQILFEISWTHLLSKALKTLGDDYKSWQKSRKELKSLIGTAASKTLVKSEQEKESKPKMAKIPEAAKDESAPPPPIINRPPEPVIDNRWRWGGDGGNSRGRRPAHR